MIKKITTVFLILLLLSVNTFVLADVSQLTINYLLNGPQDAWVTQGLAAAGQTNLDLSYLDNFSGTSANDYAKTILAVIAASQNPYNFNGQNLVDGLLGYHNNQQLGADNLLNDDFWGLMALAAASEEINSPVIQDSKNFILINQNADGGWGFSPNEPSDTNDTAAAIMALLDVGLTPAAGEIQQAIDYLHSSQNPDGGFSFYPGSESDAGSDSWVIAALYKAAIDPASWQISGQNPIVHLQSLALPDGSYRWTATNPEGNRLMTAYAAVALSESFYPVKYYQVGPTNPLLHRLRLEGLNQTYCDQMIEANTALDIVENGAAVCNYTYQIQQSLLGPYLISINSETASGTSGWLYRVNWILPNIGANQYQLEENDDVLWYFGEPSFLPLKIYLSDEQIELNEQVTATVEYFNNDVWLPADLATVYVGNNAYSTNGLGQAIFSINQTGNYQVYAEKNNYIRSDRTDLTVGNGVSQTINLFVNIENSITPTSTISFIVNNSNLSFGTLTPGQASSSPLIITNNGTVPIYLEATVAGDAVFQDNLYLNQALWENFSSVLSTNQDLAVSTQLIVPVNFGSSGQKQGSLIFWATSQ